MVQKQHLKPTVLFFFQILFIIPSANVWVAFTFFKKIKKSLPGCTWHQGRAGPRVLKGSIACRLMLFSLPDGIAYLIQLFYAKQLENWFCIFALGSCNSHWKFDKKKLIESKIKYFKMLLYIKASTFQGRPRKSQGGFRMLLHVPFHCVCVHVHWLSNPHS